jgi:hypothetical protein
VKADADLIEAWEANPQVEVAVIVHVDGSPEQYRTALIDLGMQVDRVFRLTNTISARGPASSVLGLLQVSWVQKVELDQTITTMI